MAYNSKMTLLPFDRRAEYLSELFKIDFDEASKDCLKYNLGGAFTFSCLSKKAIAQLNAIDCSIVKAIASCYCAGEWNKAYNLFRRVGLEKHGFVAEHTIPCAVAYSWIAKDKSRQTKESLEHLFKSEVLIQCGITSTEDFYLRQAGLSRKMPSAWNGVIDVDATFARYKMIGISPVKLEEIV